MIEVLRSYASTGRRWWDDSIPGHASRRVQELNLATHILALSAQQVLCTAPLVVAMSAVLQRFSGRGVGLIMSSVFGLHGAAQADVVALFRGSSDSVGLNQLVLGLIVSIGFATGVAATQQRGFELMWNLDRAGVVRSLARQILWAGALPCYVVAMVLTSRFAHEIGSLLRVGPFAAAFVQGVVTMLFYWWTQHLLLFGRVSWRQLAPGAVCVAVGTIILFRVSRLVLPWQIVDEDTDYGLIGAVFVLSVWLMVLSAIVLGGVLAGALIADRRVKGPAEPR